MSGQKYFYFTIGPVQGFVSQARRTRDFWAGSFLLSWMAGVAMVAVKKQGGTIKFPTPAKNYLDWIQGDKKGDAPEHGSIPNRFTATVSDDFNPDAVVKLVQTAWRELAEGVWQRDVAKIAEHGKDTRQIWERQIADFWEISWVISDQNENNFLDRRKNWRAHFPKSEPGSKCMVMDGWQEISGYEHSPKKERDKQKYFWEALHKNGSNSINTDLSDNEKLCAIAFVKRRFVRYFADFKHDADGISLRGWQLSPTRPSVAYLAAVHWIEEILLHDDKEKSRKALRSLREISEGYSEWDTRIHCLESALQRRTDLHRKDIALDGETFFETSWQDSDIKSTFRALKIESPSPFYALLLMDGDSLGVHMGDENNQPKIADALNKFTNNVPEVVKRNNGFLVYAGGDDVLAVLPLEDALNCAKELHSEYDKSFKGTNIPSTLSGAIEFAHFKTPLGAILQDAHRLLDDVAKDGCGRDAIAIRAWKSGGIAFTWAQPWDIALKDGEVEIEKTVEDLRKNHEDGEQSIFSSKFLYKIREQFELLNPQKDGKVLFSEDQITSLIAAEYLSSGAVDEGKTTIQEAKEIIEPLLTQCRPQVRNLETGKPESTGLLKVDGALLVRFLAYKGKDVRR